MDRRVDLQSTDLGYSLARKFGSPAGILRCASRFEVLVKIGLRGNTRSWVSLTGYQPLGAGIVETSTFIDVIVDVRLLIVIGGGVIIATMVARLVMVEIEVSKYTGGVTVELT